MAQEPRSLSWVTPAKYVGPAIVIIFAVTGGLAAWFAMDERFNEAIVTLLFTISFLLRVASKSVFYAQLVNEFFDVLFFFHVKRHDFELKVQTLFQ